MIKKYIPAPFKQLGQSSRFVSQSQTQFLGIHSSLMDTFPEIINEEKSEADLLLVS